MKLKQIDDVSLSGGGTRIVRAQSLWSRNKHKIQNPQLIIIDWKLPPL